MVRNGLFYFHYDYNSYRQNYFDICHPFFLELSNASSLPEASTGQTKSSSSFMHEDPIIYREIHEACAPATPQLAETVLDQEFVTGPSQVQSELTTFKLFHDSTTSSILIWEMVELVIPVKCGKMAPVLVDCCSVQFLFHKFMIVNKLMEVFFIKIIGVVDIYGVTC